MLSMLTLLASAGAAGAQAAPTVGIISGAAAAAPPAQHFVASMFSGNGGFASPESGMMLATSSDGTFTNIAGPNASRAAPLYTRADVRDPSLLRWSDGQW